MKVVAIIQARMGSTRLPGKVMMKIQGKTVLDHVISRVKQSKIIDDIVIATTTILDDTIIVEETNRLNVKYFRGSKDDVLSRYYYAAKENGADIVVRITSDCPLIDPYVVDDTVRHYFEEEADIVTNAGPILSERTFPRGLDVEVFSFDILKKAFENATETYQREHVTPYIYENSKKIYFHKNNVDYSRHRWTLDTEEDFELISEIYERLFKGKHDFYLKKIIELFDKEPELFQINAHVEQKKIK